MFLRKRDYDKRITRENLNALISATETTLDEIEDNAIHGEIAPYLSHRYDIDTIFADLNIYDDAATYSSGDWVLYPNEDGDIYVVDEDTSAGEDPLDTPAKFTKGDPRSKTMIHIVLDFVVYNANALISPRQIQAHRQLRYERAMDMLIKIQSGDINPAELPELSASTQKGYVIRYSTTQTKNNLHF